MKILAVILLCALIYTVRADFKKSVESIKAVIKECKKLNGDTDDDVEATLAFEPAANTNAKCMRACAMEKLGLLKDGKIVKEAHVKFYIDLLHDNPAKEDLAEEMVKICNDIKVSKDHCEAADEYIACAKKESDARNLKIF